MVTEASASSGILTRGENRKIYVKKTELVLSCAFILATGWREVQIVIFYLDRYIRAYSIHLRSRH